MFTEDFNMTIGFIGLGNMGGAIIGGIVKSGLFAPSDIYGSDKSPEMAESVKEKYQINIWIMWNFPRRLISWFLP